ncbi:hypothetical protein ACO2RV_18795 [Ancylobacter sp. VNQ12]|uniref:hypothetical protein n=1 Tax=Ancylobacter sp. VNQ12 TaxID=3400920 RepID=UPI003C070708
MRTVLLPLALVFLATPALAQSLPNSLNMTCAAATALVRQQGGVVIATGPNLYDRYVANQRYCEVDQTTVPAWVQTSDQNECFVGYRCRDRMFRNR